MIGKLPLIRIILVAALGGAASCTCLQSDMGKDRRDWDELEQALPRLDKREQVRRLEVFLESHPPNKKRIFGTHSRTPQHQAHLRLEALKGELARDAPQRRGKERR